MNDQNPDTTSCSKIQKMGQSLDLSHDKSIEKTLALSNIDGNKTANVTARDDELTQALSELVVVDPNNPLQTSMDTTLREAIRRKRSLQEQQESMMTGYLEIFEKKGKELTSLKKKQKELADVLLRIQNENEEIKKKNDYSLKEINEAEIKNKDLSREINSLKDVLLESQTSVSKICAQESEEIHNIQNERDKQLRKFDQSM